LLRKDELRIKFEELESSTVSNSFGGEAIEGRAPVFAFKPTIKWFLENLTAQDGEIFNNFETLKDNTTHAELQYIIECLGRFAFCIELTNLGITSTKMKTRWVDVKIIKTIENAFTNYEGDFKPGSDPRSSTFDECYLVLEECIRLLINSEDHKSMMGYFSNKNHRGIPYESVFTYIDQASNPIHVAENIRLTNLIDAEWLVKARPIIRPVISAVDKDGDKAKCVSKISTKCYKTDRSQTGEEQTNRAKRWECLIKDFQHASIEDCWSVEKKLLSDISHFSGFPVETKELLIESGLFDSQQSTAVCPITLQPMVYSDLLTGGEHGESTFQVGHIMPLKADGKHKGDNIAWISNDGNRIQGSLNITETRLMLKGIFERMNDSGLL
jgi:hypothetical protein